MTRSLLMEDYDKTRYEIDLPLTSLVDYSKVREELGVPSYLDPSNFLLERGFVTIWAAAKARALFQSRDLPSKVAENPIPILFFGGAAVKVLSPEANNPASPLYREINDIDLVTSKKRGTDLCKILLALGDMCGSRYHHFVTRSDRRFNAMRAGKRYRLRAIDKVLEGTLEVGVLDIFAEEVNLRHRVDVRAALEEPESYTYTVGAENVLLTKCQYIFDLPRSLEQEMAKQGLEYRILNYPPYRDDRLIVGMEEKDLKDVCALLIDRKVGEGPGDLNPAVIKEVLDRDEKFALTVRLNLENILRNEELLTNLGLQPSSIEVIHARINEILESIRVPAKRWRNPWWNVDVETPQIFGKTVP